MNSTVAFHKTLPASTADWPLSPRPVRFEWRTSPLHWLPHNPFASHCVNHFSFTLVRGEYFFCRMMNKALPLVHDKKLHHDMKVFVRQEAIHSRAHQDAIEQYLQRYGVPIAAQYARVVKIFDHLLADQPLGFKLPQALQRQWLLLRVGLVAAAEHYTCALGQYVLTQSHWAARDADPVISDLFTWHCAEEVEHRTVAHDAFVHLGGSYVQRVAIMAITAPLFTYLMAAGTAQLAQADASMPKHQRKMTQLGFWRAWQKSAQQKDVPSPWWFIHTSFRFFKPSYHPYYEGSTALALAYIEQSAAVLAAQTPQSSEL